MKYKIKEIFDLQMGKTPARNNDKYWNTKDYKWISIADLTSTDKYINNTKEYISRSAVKESGIKIIPANTVVMSFKLSIGKTAILSEDMYSNEAIMAFHDKHVVELLPEYTYYLIKAKNWNGGSNRAVMGQTLNKATLSEIEVDVHAIEDQRKIVKLMSSIEKIIYNRKEQLQKLGDILRARFFELFGDLVEGDKIKDNRRKIGDIASVTKLAGFEFTKYIKYKDIGSIGDSDVIMLRGLNCKGGKLVLDDIKWIDRETSDLLPRSKLYVGDILITYAGTIGDIALVDEDNKYHLAPNVGKISIIDKLSYDPVFLVHLLMYSNKYIMSFASKVAQASINMQKIRNFEYYFPSFEEQKHFSTFVEQVNKSKVEVQKALDKAQLLFDSLMQKYFG